MRLQLREKFSSVVIALTLSLSATAFAKSGGNGGGGGTGNCNGNGNVKHGCGSSVVTPDILTSTSQGNPRQPTNPIPVANQLPTPQTQPHLPTEGPVAPPQRVPDPVVPTSVNVMAPAVPQQTIVPVAPQTINMVPNIPVQRVPPTPAYQPPVAPPKISQKVPEVPPHIATEGPVAPPQRVPDPVVPASVNVVAPAVPQQTILAAAPKTIQVEITDKAKSAADNQNMIANFPGRQSPNAYAVFKNESTGGYRECVVSGLERRKVILPNGQEIDRGSLPSLRTVSSELMDIPAWHPHEAGCIVSLQHKK